MVGRETAVMRPGAWLTRALFGVLAASWLWPRLGNAALVTVTTVVVVLSGAVLARRRRGPAADALWIAALLVGLAAFAPANATTPVAIGTDVRQPAAVFLLVASAICLVVLVRQGVRPVRRAAAALLVAAGLVAGAVLPGWWYAYRSVEVTWSNGDVQLVGSLHLPETGGPHPLVVFVGGSGPATRGGYESPWTQALAREGIALFAYDKRGSGASRGGSPHDPFTALASDVAIAIDHLVARPEISSTIGLWGFSEGGWVAPLAASLDERVDFLVLTSGGGVSVGRNATYQDSLRMHRAGFTEDQIDTAWALRAAVNDYYRNGRGRRQLEARIRAVLAEPWGREAAGTVAFPTPDHLAPSGSQRAQEWLERWHYSSLPVLKRLRIPFLSLHGGDDQLDPAYESAAALRKLASHGSTWESRVLLYDDASHTIAQHPFGIRWLPPHFPPGHVTTVGGWIAQRTSAPAGSA